MEMRVVLLERKEPNLLLFVVENLMAEEFENLIFVVDLLKKKMMKKKFC